MPTPLVSRQQEYSKVFAYLEVLKMITKTALSFRNFPSGHWSEACYFQRMFNSSPHLKQSKVIAKRGWLMASVKQIWWLPVQFPRDSFSLLRSPLLTDNLSRGQRLTEPASHSGESLAALGHAGRILHSPCPSEHLLGDWRVHVPLGSS